MADNVFEKDPEAVLDYQVDWSNWLDEDTIATSVWVAQTGLTVDSDTETTTTATAIVSGGTAGSTYTLENKITTAGGLTDERTLYIVCVER